MLERVLCYNNIIEKQAGIRGNEGEINTEENIKTVSSVPDFHFRIVLNVPQYDRSWEERLRCYFIKHSESFINKLLTHRRGNVEGCQVCKKKVRRQLFCKV